MNPVIVGAVLYDPKVSVIWEIIRDFFEENHCPMDVVFYTNYEMQVKALLAGHLDIAWNSPLAWLDAQRQSGGRCRAIAMRDTDCDRETCFLTGAESGFTKLQDLRGCTIALGAKDSPQATLIPLGVLARHGLEAERDLTVRRFDVLVGKHGDHVGGERNAFECLQRGEADACALLDLNFHAWKADGSLNDRDYHVLATTGQFDHCVFTAREDFSQAAETHWLKTLFTMSYENPAHREMMDLEGLKRWMPGRTTGFALLTEAVAKLEFFS